MEPPTIAAVATVRRYRQQEHCPRLVNLLHASQSPLPLARLPLVGAAAVKRERIKATTAAATTGRRSRQQQHSRRPLVSSPASQSATPLPRLLLSISSRYGYANGTTNHRRAATTGHRHRQQQHGRRPLTSAPAPPVATAIAAGAA